MEDTKACDPWETPMPYDDESSTIHSDSLEISTCTPSPSVISIILPSLLPLTYVTDNVSVSSGTSFASNAFDTLTYHRELREAQVDSDFDRIVARLLSEWYYTGASVNVVFTVPPSGVGLLSIPASFHHSVDISVKFVYLFCMS